MLSNDDNKGYIIRLATTDDIEALTELHCASFQPGEHVPVMLGRDYVRATYRWLVSGKQAYGLVAEIDEKIIGLIAVCDGSYTRPMFMACLPEFIAALLRSPGLLFQKRLWERLFRRPDATKAGKIIVDYPGFAQITIGAVDVNYRDVGVFRALVNATKFYSQQRGSRAIRVGIYKMNGPSRKVFIRGGWIETHQLETRDTVFYVHIIDTSFPSEIGITLSQSWLERIPRVDHASKV